MSHDHEDDVPESGVPAPAGRPERLTTLWERARRALENLARAHAPLPADDLASVPEFVAADEALTAIVDASDDHRDGLDEHLADARARLSETRLHAAGYRYEREEARRAARTLWALLTDDQQAAARATLGTLLSKPWLPQAHDDERDDEGRRIVQAELSRLATGGQGNVRAAGLHPGEEVVLTDADAEPVTALVVEVRADARGEIATVRTLSSPIGGPGGPVARWGAVELPMACTCSEAGRAEAAALATAVCARLHTTPETVVNEAIRSLARDYGFGAVDAYTDQWTVVDASHWDGRRVIIQCDDLSPGVLAVWQHVAHENLARS